MAAGYARGVAPSPRAAVPDAAHPTDPPEVTADRPNMWNRGTSTTWPSGTSALATARGSAQVALHVTHRHLAARAHRRPQAHLATRRLLVGLRAPEVEPIVVA